jgi:hypothetical protein
VTIRKITTFKGEGIECCIDKGVASVQLQGVDGSWKVYELKLCKLEEWTEIMCELASEMNKEGLRQEVNKR